MKKLLDNPYFVGALVIVALYVAFKGKVDEWISGFRQSPAQIEAQTNVVATASVATPRLAQKTEPAVLPDVKIDVDSIQWILKPSRNPFQPLKYPSGEASYTNDQEVVADEQSFVLSAILFEKNQKFAVINNRVIAQGERIGGYKLEVIERDHVVLSGFGTKRRLNFVAVDKPQNATDNQPKTPMEN